MFYDNETNKMLLIDIEGDRSYVLRGITSFTTIGGVDIQGVAYEQYGLYNQYTFGFTFKRGAKASVEGNTVYFKRYRGPEYWIGD